MDTTIKNSKLKAYFSVALIVAFVFTATLSACAPAPTPEEKALPEEVAPTPLPEETDAAVMTPVHPPIDIPNIPLYKPLSLDTAGNIIHIPGEYTTIQEGIDAAVDGDAVLVAPGTYYENIDFRGKSITVMSEAGPDDTIIDGGRVTSVVTFWNGEDTNSVLHGFTITNGLVRDPFPFGGGISIRDASPTISYCIISKNGSEQVGGGIYVEGNQARPVIENNYISNNIAVIRGGGIAVRDGASPTIRDNIIIDNWGTQRGAGIELVYGASGVIEGNTISNNQGGYDIRPDRVEPYLDGVDITPDEDPGITFPDGILVVHQSSPIIRSNVITGNSGGGIGVLLGSAPTIENNIISRNAGMIAGGILVALDSTPVVTNNTIECNLGPAISIDKTSSILDEQLSPMLVEPSTLIQETDEAFTFLGHWDSWSSPYSSGGTRIASFQPGATAQIRFSGTQISLIYGAHLSHGIAKIDIDGIAYPSIDMYAPVGLSRVEKLIATGLSPGEHVLTITVSSERNVVIDAVRVGGEPSTGQNQVTGSVILWPSSSPEREGRSSERVLLVPSGYNTIQGAIKAANHGDTIIVALGTYRENLDFLGKRITLRSQNPDDIETVESTILEAKESGYKVNATVNFVSGETRETTLAGFTIRNGLGGMGIYIFGSSPTITQNIISDSTGGGIAIFEADSPLITGNTIKNNIAHIGGGILVRFSSAMVIGNVITGNQADAVGGGFNVWFSSPTIINNTINNNKAIHHGGGLYIEHYSQPIIRGNSISGNTAESLGGGIKMDMSSSPIIDGNIITDNRALAGAGLGMILHSHPQITNNVFARNNVWAIFIETSHPEMTNNTIVDNIDDHGRSRGIIVLGNSNVFITNTILWDSEIYMSDEYSDIIITYSLVKDGWPGKGNISQAPLFVSDGDYRLLPTSPGIDAGTNVSVNMDIDGNERPQGQGFDIGAYEYVTQD